MRREPGGTAWIQFNIRFYVFALIFVVFDVEAAFLLPWARCSASSGRLALFEGFVFIGILFLGLAYVWRKGDLEWVRPEDRAERAEPVSGVIQNRFEDGLIVTTADESSTGAASPHLVHDLRPRLLRDRDDGDRRPAASTSTASGSCRAARRARPT